MSEGRETSSGSSGAKTVSEGRETSSGSSGANPINNLE